MPHHGALPGLVVHGADMHTDVTRSIWMSVGEGFVKVGTLGEKASYATVEGAADGAGDPTVHWTIDVPEDFVSFESVQALWETAAVAGNMRWYTHAHYAAPGEVYTTHVDQPASGETANLGSGKLNLQLPVNPLTLTDLAVGDKLGLMFLRDGAHANDTLDTPMRLYGLLFTYTARQ